MKIKKQANFIDEYKKLLNEELLEESLLKSDFTFGFELDTVKVGLVDLSKDSIGYLKYIK